MILSIRIAGPPVPKGRPRVTRNKKDESHTHTPRRTRHYEQRIAYETEQVMRSQGLQEPLTAPLVLMVVLCLPVPKSWPLWKRQAALRGQIRPTVKPDWDNGAKITDALNGVLWEDDAQIVTALVQKRYAKTPSLLVQIKTIPALTTQNARKKDLP